jgi:HTH-type transcriptional regulator/antitoxin MqsA
MDKRLCDMCGVGHVTNEIEDRKVTFRGRAGTIITHYRKCDHCKGEYASAVEARLNAQAMKTYMETIEQEMGDAQKEEVPKADGSST